jgi:hypothetical protein
MCICCNSLDFITSDPIFWLSDYSHIIGGWFDQSSIAIERTNLEKIETSIALHLCHFI